MKTGLHHALLAVPALLALSACEIRDTDDMPDVTVDEPADEESDAEVLPPDYPPPPSIEPTEPSADDMGEASPSEDSMAPEDDVIDGHGGPGSEPPES